MLTLKGYVTGRVQGVGFRYFVRGQAQGNLVSGYAKNLPDGRVEFLLQGDPVAVETVLKQLHRGPALSVVESVDYREVPNSELTEGFDIL